MEKLIVRDGRKGKVKGQILPTAKIYRVNLEPAAHGTARVWTKHTLIVGKIHL